MGAIEETLEANADFSKNFRLAQAPRIPARRLAILACMDARLSLEPILGISTGDAHIIRNAGGVATGDAIRSLLVSHYLLGTQEFMVINHTDCGMLSFKDEELAERLERETGTPALSPSRFYSFADVDRNVRRQLALLKSHPWIPRSIEIRGFVYDVGSGRLRGVSAS